MAKIKADLDLHKLEIFYWVAEQKSFSRAAKLLSLRQPTVSAHIQELEQAIGGKLFYRVPGKVSLTPLGLVVAEKAKSLLAFKREAVSAIEHFHGTLSGELWVGGSSIPGGYLLPSKLGEFAGKYPRVTPILRIGDSAEVVEDLLDGKIELGFVGVKKSDSRLQFDKIWDDEMVVAVPQGHPWSRRKEITVGELKTEKFISREHGSGTLDAILELLSSSGEAVSSLLNISMVLGSTEAVKQALFAGYGFSILSRVSIQHELDDARITEVPIQGLKMVRGFYEVFHAHRPLHPVAQAFREFLKTN